ncbi:MAG: sodium:solute symporter family protein [bacterium]|nr:sodium:solute symporter family protein [bacterium]
MIATSPLSLAIILVCALGVPAAGFWAARSRIGGAEAGLDYLSLGRRLSLPAFVATLVCTWYGGILAVGEYTWTWGLVNWLALGFFYYVFAALYAVFLAQRVRHSRALSIPEEIARRHGRPAGRVAALFTLVMVSPAPHILTTALILGALSGLPLALTLPLTLVLVVAYVWQGGLRSVVVTDVVQFALMFTGFALALGWLMTEQGGLAWLAGRLPSGHLAIPGGLSWSTIVLWGFVAMWTLVDPGFHQRVAVARDVPTARRGIWISIACWFAFDALTTGCGLYARALLPDLEHPVKAFPLLAGMLPPVVQGLFVGGMLATVLSTLDSLCFLSGSTFARDLLGGKDDAGLPSRIRWGILLTSGLGALLAWRLQSVVQLWILFASLGVPVLLPALMSAYLSPGLSPGLTPRLSRGLVSMILAAVASTAWMAAGFLRSDGAWPEWPWGLEPLFPGLAAGLLPYVVDLRLWAGKGRET